MLCHMDIPELHKFGDWIISNSNEIVNETPYRQLSPITIRDGEYFRFIVLYDQIYMESG